MIQAKTILCATGAVAAAITLGGCVSVGAMGKGKSSIHWQADGVPYHIDPGHEWWHYQFAYHPNAQVYYEPYSATYFWNEDGNWFSGQELPPWISLDASVARAVKLNTQWPHTHHETSLATAGPIYNQHQPSPWSEYVDSDMAYTSAEDSNSSSYYDEH